jgi:hypothetical protein
MKNDGDDDARGCCDDGCNLPWDGFWRRPMVGGRPSFRLVEELLSCGWLAVALEPAVVFARKNIQSQAKKVARQSSQNPWAEKCRFQIKLILYKKKEEGVEGPQTGVNQAPSCP